MNEEQNNIPPANMPVNNYLKQMLPALNEMSKNSMTSTRATETNLGFDLANDDEYLQSGLNLANYFGHSDTETIRAMHQSDSARTARGIGRIGTRVLSEVAKIPGYAGGLVGAAFADEGEGWETAFNNSWVKFIENTTNDINNNALAVYSPEEYRTAGIGGKLTDLNFWATEGADGIGYLVSMMAPGAALNRLKLGKGLLRGITTPLSLDNKRRQVSALQGLSKLGINADRLDSALITVANTYFEAGSEAGNAMRTFEEGKPKFIEQYTSEKLSKLDRDFASGNISREVYISNRNQIVIDAETAFNQQKGRLGRDIFFANAAILLGPNAIQTNILFGKGASKYVTDLAKPKTYQSALKGLGVGILSEGFFEEGMQSTVEGIFSKKAEDNQLTTNILNDFTINDIIEGYTDTLTSVEGQSAIFLGSVLGGTMNMVGQIRSDRNDYKASQAIATKFGTLPGDMLKTINSLYKKDKDGNIVLYKNNKPQLDLKGAKLAAFRHIGSDTMNQIQDNALLENNEDLVRYIKETYASDLGMSFGLLDNNEQVRNASGEALNQYLEDQITAIQENTKLDDATKEIMIKDAQETAAIARKMYNKTIQMNDALQVLQGSISPELDSKFVGPSAEEAKRAFLTAQRIDIIRNRYNSGLLNDTIERKRNKLKNLLDTLEIPEVDPDYLHRAPTEADYERGTLLAKRAAQNPLTAALQQEIESLEEYKKEVDSEYKNTLTNPEYMSKELTEFSNELTAENKRSNLDYKFNEVADSISKAKDINELDKIKLDPTLKDTHKDAFDAAIGKKRAELNKIKKEQEAGVKAQNQFADNVITEINNITYDNDPSISLSDSVSLDSTTIQSSQEVDPNNIEGEVFNDSEGYLFRLDEDNPSFTESGQSHWESAEQRATREANEEIANELKNKESQESQESKEEVVKSKNINEEEGLPSEDSGTPSEEETPDEVASNNPVEYIFPEPTKLNTGTVEDITVPDDPDNLAEEEVIEGGVNENDIIANIDLNNTPEDVETKYSIQDGNLMIHFITRLPRLIFDTSQKVGEKVWDYLNNHKSKANDVYNIKVWTHNKNGYGNKFPAAQPGLRAYEKLVRFQKQGGEALTIEDYENLLYRLPLLATLSTDSDIQMWIDGLSQDNFEIVDGKVRMKKDTSYGFINAFNIRLQIINALLQDVDTPISLKFAKQIKGKLNVNRDANGRSVMSDISKMAEFSKLSEDREAQVKAIQESLAYVDTNRIVRGLANGETISGGAKTPGIIYVRLANRDGSVQNIQVSRKKVSDDAGDGGVSTLDMLVMMIQDATAEGNPYTMKFDDFMASMTNKENADMINRRFEKVKTILNEHNPNYTVYDFFNFFYHTSSNNKTKLNFQEGHIYVGRLVEKLGIPSDVLSQHVKKSPDGLLYMNSDSLSTDEGAKILKGYLNMLKQHVRVDLAKDPMYIEYLIDNVLMTDIKPEETFTLNFKGYERKNGRVIFHKGNRPLESNVFVSNLVSTPNVDRVMKIPNEVIENMPPELRAITERVGLSTEVVNKPSNVGGGQPITSESEIRKKIEESNRPINFKKGDIIEIDDMTSGGPMTGRHTVTRVSKYGYQLDNSDIWYDFKRPNRGWTFKNITQSERIRNSHNTTGTTAQEVVSKTISTLESQPAPTHNTASYTIVPATQSTTETQIAEIERGRQVELFNSLTETQKEFVLKIPEEERRNRQIKIHAGRTEKGRDILERHSAEDALNNPNASIEEKVAARYHFKHGGAYNVQRVSTVREEINKIKDGKPLLHEGEKIKEIYEAELAASEAQPTVSQQSTTSEQKPTNKVITKDTIIDSGVLYMRGTAGAGLYLSNEGIINGFRGVDFRMLYDSSYPTEATVLKKLDEVITRFGEYNVKYIARKVGDMWMILQEGKDSNLLSVHFQVTERGTPRRGSHSAVILKLPKDVTVNQEGLNNILPMINQFRANNYEIIDGRLRPKNKENDTTLDLNLISSNVSQQPSSLESKPEAITPGEQIQLDLFNDESITATTEDALVEQFTEALNNLPEQQIQELNEEVQEDASLREYDGTGANEISSTAESPENISTTSEAIKQAATGTSESELSKLEAFFNNADMRDKAKTLMTMMSMSNIKLTPTMMTANNMDSTFRSLLENIKQGNKVSELLNKICTK